ncbi:bifunctional DNA topoisomerase [Babesia duncani]|uniref:DNA topoisomerase n=1 Tax=Babesia duncani TaxID=323732 RepID=A0AAD9PJQ0_9APIC|nr:bifunctional DNA topoisomerase [Babesia duncani]
MVHKTEVSKHPPRPLDTVEMHKCAARYLGISSHDCMKLAEALYNKGYISYPRTETNVFPQTMDIASLVHAFTSDATFGNYASQLLSTGISNLATRGGKSDEAHPPIHPVKLLERSSADSDMQWKLYEFIMRRFLASCSDPALGNLSIIFIDIAGEGFHCKGMNITKRSWLDIYPHESWTNSQVPDLQQNDTFTPSEIVLQEGSTSPPGLLSESQLINLMHRQVLHASSIYAEMV